MSGTVLITSLKQQVGGQAEEVAEAITRLSQDASCFQIDGKNSVALSITVVLNPLSKVAQQLSETLIFLRKTLQPTIKVTHLHTRLARSDLSVNIADE